MAFHIKIPLTYQAHFPKFGIYINPPLPVLLLQFNFSQRDKKTNVVLQKLAHLKSWTGNCWYYLRLLLPISFTFNTSGLFSTWITGTPFIYIYECIVIHEQNCNEIWLITFDIKFCNYSYSFIAHFSSFINCYVDN